MDTSNHTDKSHYDLLKFSLKAKDYLIAEDFELVTLLNGACNTAALK